MTGCAPLFYKLLENPDVFSVKYVYPLQTGDV